MIVDAGLNLPVSAFTKIGTKPALFGRAWIWFDTVSTAAWKKITKHYMYILLLGKDYQLIMQQKCQLLYR